MERLLTIFLFILLHSLSFCGTIEGIVNRQAKPITSSSINRYSSRNSVPHPNIDSYQNNNQAVVFLMSNKKLRYPTPSSHPQMEQINQSFKPWLLPILVGTTVDFPNSDPIFHNVFSYSKPQKFDLGRYSKGESKSVTFNKPGLVKVFCEIHKSMRAYILILETPYFTTTDSTDHFILSDIPPGKYTLNIWQENLPDFQKKIMVTQQDTIFVEIK